MKTLEEYVEEHGFTIDDFNADEIERLNAEVEVVNNGGHVLDGVFAVKEIPDYSKN